MTNNHIQKQKAQQFYQLHHTGRLLVLPNIWDPLGAILLESLGYPAIATASAAVAYSNGYNDGENIPFDYLLVLLKRIAGTVNVPVTADVESGYADDDVQLQKNIALLIDTGIVGINIEDTDKKTKRLHPVEIQCNRIRLIKKISNEMGIPLFINARTDVYIHGDDFEKAEQKFDEILKRGLAYRDAGADCFFPIAMRQKEDIENLISNLQMPINIITMPGIPDLHTLGKMGIARISLGPSFLKIAMKAMKKLALELKDCEGLSTITENEITSEYLKTLVNKNY